jgi:hypothetical protein
MQRDKADFAVGVLPHGPVAQFLQSATVADGRTGHRDAIVQILYAVSHVKQRRGVQTNDVLARTRVFPAITRSKVSASR